jgi:anti-sigma B factor antagonist
VPAMRIRSRPRSSELLIVQRSSGPDSRLSICGEVDLATAPDLEQALHNAERRMPQRIVLELSALRFIDSSGLHLLCTAHARAEEHGRSLVLEGAPPHIRNLLGIVGLNGLLSDADAAPRATA